ncbi:DUF4276 family protein [Streptomyces sp. NPDC004749]
MRQVHVLVEGATEERLVQQVLQPELLVRDIWVTPVALKTRRAAGRPHDKGGVSRWPKIEHDIRALLRNPAVDTVTTMLDLYGLPSDTPGLSGARPVTRTLASAISRRRWHGSSTTSDSCPSSSSTRRRPGYSPPRTNLPS